MRFSLASIFLGFALVGLSLGVFGLWGILVAGVLLYILACPHFVHSHREALASLGIVSVMVILLLALLWPASFGSHDHARGYCMMNLEQIHMALARYQAQYVTLPAIHENDLAGQPLCSWRVTLNLEDAARKYDHSEPWDGPKNTALITALDIYACRTASRGLRKGTTTYLAVLGPDGDWLKAEPKNAQMANPVRIVEVPGSDVLWTEPRDISLDDYSQAVLEPSALALWHQDEASFFYHAPPPAIHALFMDGTVQAIRPNIPADVLRAALLGDREKQKELDAFAAPTLNWGKCAGLGLLVVLFVLMLAHALRTRRVGRVEQASLG